MVSATTSSAASKQNFDPAALFREIGEDRELFHSLVETARHDLPEYLEKIIESAASGDPMGVRASAHAMKTTLAHWQAAEACQMAQAVELLCREGNPQEAIRLIPPLVKLVRGVVADLQRVEARL